MQMGMKIAIALVALALAVVLALIALVRLPGSGSAPQILTEIAQPSTAEPQPEIEKELARAAEEAARDEADPSIVMYEGALAGLTEEEIATLALSEESGHVEADLEEGID